MIKTTKIQVHSMAENNSNTYTHITAAAPIVLLLLVVAVVVVVLVIVVFMIFNVILFSPAFVFRVLFIITILFNTKDLLFLKKQQKKSNSYDYDDVIKNVLEIFVWTISFSATTTTTTITPITVIITLTFKSLNNEEEY